ncbi:MAG: MBL fold metallo-hydrolase [Methanomicrobiaceae archaeon]|uniref:Metal-dependent hydrolase of the beta-lactamase superfamily i n=1 Tax=hydrocarbon metagenome TaxID=938273 RepID=A0A0W8FDI2_9ZZZZ|nr:MBL fold metallo-hydrolase [Methanomicrobiaceae archaeon]MDD5419258.1 MBL fold metallo-hydrolase [Methanomicrobiaceae archaeon]
MELTILASGSKGNCAYLAGESGALLIDAGLSARELLRRLHAAGCDAARIQAILVTHEHTDHIRGVNALARRLDVPVYATGGTLEELCFRSRAQVLDAKRCICGQQFRVGDLLVEPFATSHDAREPCGYCISDGDVRVGCCTDTGIVTSGIMDHLSSCDAVILESNHCPDMLKRGPYPEFLKRRISSQRGHLSNAAAAICLQELADAVRHVVLAHVSEVNNTPERVLAQARGGLGLFTHVQVSVAAQHPDLSGSGAVRIRM